MTVDADARATARRHTARLLKMLRGYGPTAETEPVSDPPAAAPKPAAVAEAPTAYVRLLDTTVPTPQPPSPVVQASPPRLPPAGRVGPGSIPTVGELLRDSLPPGVLGQLIARASQMIHLRQVFRAYLPPHLRDHALLIRLDPEGWEVQTDSAGWATRLRYALPTIRQALGQQLGMTLPKPRIRVAPPAMPAQLEKPRLKLTRRNAELLETAAHALTDPRLGAALRRLAAHGRAGFPPQCD
jgi:hypothetical protein